MPFRYSSISSNSPIVLLGLADPCQWRTPSIQYSKKNQCYSTCNHCQLPTATVITSNNREQCCPCQNTVMGFKRVRSDGECGYDIISSVLWSWAWWQQCIKLCWVIIKMLEQPEQEYTMHSELLGILEETWLGS